MNPGVLLFEDNYHLYFKSLLHGQDMRIRFFQMLNINSKTAKFSSLNNQQGFTLIELISVLIILGVVASIAVKKHYELADNASLTVLRSAVGELKAKESAAWFKIKVSGYTSDSDVYNAVDKSMSEGIRWDPGPEISGGTLNLRAVSVNLTRIPSTENAPGTWN